MAQEKGIFGGRREGGGNPLDASIPSGAEAEHLEQEAMRRIPEASRQAEREAAGRAEQLEDAKRERDAATRTLQETLVRLEDAERRAYAETEVRERIARIEGDAEERLRAEVTVARKAAEDRFAERLANRERTLELEREQKVRLIEESDRRLSQIEARAVEAAERVDAAERRLAEEVRHLRADAETHATAEAERARKEATEAAEARVREREAELAESLAVSERAKRAVEAQVADAERGWEVERSSLATDLDAARRRIEQVEARASEAEARAERAEVALNDLAGTHREDRNQEPATRGGEPTAEVEAEAAEQASESKRTGFRGLLGRSARSAPTPVTVDDDLDDVNPGERGDGVESPEPEPIVEAPPRRIVYSRVPPNPREVREP